MRNERFIGYTLVAIGALALLSNIGRGSGWFWVGLVAAGFLAAYLSQRNYGFLVVGSVLTGVAVGILLEGAWGPGAFLISLGIGFFAIDRVEPRKNRWPVYVAALLVLLGLLSGLAETGILGSIWFALLLIAAGAYLLMREREAKGLSSPWVRVDTPPYEPAESERVQPVEKATPPVTPEARPEENLMAPGGGTGAAAAPEVAPPPEPATTPPADTLAERERYHRLEAWRRKAAAEANMPAYIVLRNESIAQIAKENPQTLEALRDIKGIGPVKLERYGHAILAALNETPAEHSS